MSENKNFFDLSQSYVLEGCYIEVTSRCNLRCLHCYNESGELKEELSMEAFLNAISGLPNSEDVSVTLSGGEPLLHPQIWDFIKIIQERGYKKNLIITNATLIDKNVAKRLVDSGIGVQISINGSCNEYHDKLCGKGNFEKTMQGFENLIELGYSDKMVVRCMVSKFNEYDVKSLIKMLVNKGIKTINISPLTLLGRAKSNIEEMYFNYEEKTRLLNRLNSDTYISELKKQGIKITLPEGYSGGCPLIYENENKLPLNPRIDSQGNVFICQMFLDDIYSIGNINFDKLSNIVLDQKMSHLIWFLRFGIVYMKDCKNCIWKTTCGKGCVAAALANGSVQTTDGDCFFRKEGLYKEFKEKIKD